MLDTKELKYETPSEFISRNGCSNVELSDAERLKVLKKKDVVLDTIEVGGEKFVRISYMSIGGTRIDSHVQGQYGDRFFEAQQRDNLIKVIGVKV